MTDFELFQREFKRWQRRLGLTGYKTYFRYEPIGDSFARITLNQPDCVATIRFNSEPDKDAIPFLDIKTSAKHEAIHLLLCRLEFMADARFVQPEEIDEEVENLVHKLEGLIK